MKKIIASGPIIIEKEKLLVTLDKKDEFYKIPGGTLKKNETLEECAKRELKEETGFECEIIKKLPTMKSNKKLEEKEEINLELNHYLAKLKNKPQKYNSFYHNEHKVFWLPLKEIKQKKYNLAPNIVFLFENEFFNKEIIKNYKTLKNQ